MFGRDAPALGGQRQILPPLHGGCSSATWSLRRSPKLEATKRHPVGHLFCNTHDPVTRGAPLEHLVHPQFVRLWVWEQSRLRVLEPTFFANGAEGGEVLERALGSPTHHLAQPRRLAAQGGTGELCTALRAILVIGGVRHIACDRPCTYAAHVHTCTKGGGRRPAARDHTGYRQKAEILARFKGNNTRRPPLFSACVGMIRVNNISARKFRAAKLVVLLSDCKRESGNSRGNIPPAPLTSFERFQPESA
jgi:hypothetical protein